MSALSGVRVEAETRAVLADLQVAPVDDPLRALLDLAGQTLAWQQATASLVNQLDGIRYAGHNGAEQLRAEVGLYERAMDRASSMLSAIARLNIEDRVARGHVRLTSITGAVAAGLTGDQLVETSAQRLFTRAFVVQVQRLASLGHLDFGYTNWGRHERRRDVRRRPGPGRTAGRDEGGPEERQAARRRNRSRDPCQYGPARRTRTYGSPEVAVRRV